MWTGQRRCWASDIPPIPNTDHRGKVSQGQQDTLMHREEGIQWGYWERQSLTICLSCLLDCGATDSGRSCLSSMLRRNKWRIRWWAASKRDTRLGTQDSLSVLTPGLWEGHTSSFVQSITRAWPAMSSANCGHAPGFHHRSLRETQFSAITNNLPITKEWT